ncbi:MFS general substrate transporter [Auriscalpium vulgare]|uniref:MFS general substrate transporter n=1 Tax=Auriscalpium vulgare TaxID=40419 RepID=A0ACB8RM45_9AGAM|nr:MFS general substrate transporter [Auriscalpium vulgare]
MSIFHDTITDYFLRAAGIKIAPHPDERDSSTWPTAAAVGGGDPEKNAPRDSASTPTSDPAIDKEKAHNVAPEGVILVEFSPDDSANPQNWPRWKKIWVMSQLSLWTFTMYIGSSIYTAGIASVSEDFHVSTVAATLGLTLFVLGYGFGMCILYPRRSLSLTTRTGPMIWAPMSEVPQLGRLPIYIFSCVMFTALQVPTALATNFGMLMAFRFIGAFFGSPVLAVGGATVADMYGPRTRAYGITLWGWFAIAAPTLGPLVGGFANHAHGWRWTIWELLWLSGFTLIVLWFFFPETSHTNILYRRAVRLRKATGNENYRAKSEISSEVYTLNDIVQMMLVRAVLLNFQEPIVLALNLYIALIYALLYCWFESLPIVFIGIYGFKDTLVGTSFLGVLMGGVLGIPMFFYYMKYWQEPKMDAEGNLKPEERMLGASIGSLFIPVCLFWFGWSSRESVHWIVPIIGSSFFTMGGVFLFNSVLNYLPDAYPDYAASVFAGNDLMRSGFGAAFPLFAGGMYHNLGIGWASSLLGFLACAFVPIPFMLYLYGDRLRYMSKRARHDI